MLCWGLISRNGVSRLSFSIIVSLEFGPEAFNKHFLFNCLHRSSSGRIPLNMTPNIQYYMCFIFVRYKNMNFCIHSFQFLYSTKWDSWKYWAWSSLKVHILAVSQWKYFYPKSIFWDVSQKGSFRNDFENWVSESGFLNVFLLETLKRFKTSKYNTSFKLD